MFKNPMVEGKKQYGLCLLPDSGIEIVATVMWAFDKISCLLEATLLVDSISGGEVSPIMDWAMSTMFCRLLRS